MEARARSFNIRLLRVPKGKNRENEGKVLPEEVRKLDLPRPKTDIKFFT